MKNINFISLATLFFFVLFGITAATVSHNASEITAGTFGTGDYTFIGNVELQKSNEVFLNIRNTEASGRQYALVSAGSLGGIGVGKFSIYDTTAGVSRLTIDSSGNVGIGTTSPTQKLDVAGYVKGQSGLCIGNDCKTSWPSGAVTSLNAGQGITLSPNPITTSGTVSLGVTSCLSDMSLIGVAGSPTAFCAENNERGSMTWQDAAATCRNAGRRLLTTEEFVLGCISGKGSGWNDNWEYTAEIENRDCGGCYGQTWGIVMGGVSGVCRSSEKRWVYEPSGSNTPAPFRCGQ